MFIVFAMELNKSAGDVADGKAFLLGRNHLSNNLQYLGGFINKNFLYFEEMTFTSPGNAPNRGGDYTQSCNALTYEQRVYFADGPAENSLVHFQNGLWLNLTTQQQMKGAYPNSGFIEGKVPQQPAVREMVKQVSVPHGNSILATGSVTTFDGAPAIPDTEMQKTLPFSSATEAEMPDCPAEPGRSQKPLPLNS